MIISRSHVRVWAFAGVALPLMLPQFAGAETIDCAAGDVQCLIAAVNVANADPHKTTIRLSDGTYVLTGVDNQINGPNGLPSIVTPITIEARGDGATLTRASDAPDFRLLHVGSSGSLTLRGIHMVDGDVFGGTALDPLSGSGGALLNDRGVVIVVNCAFDGNGASGGGAVFTNRGTMTITDTTFADNRAGGGGGLINAGGMVTLTRTVFDGNGASAGGGLWSNHGTTYISESRFIHNGASQGVGGLWVTGGTASIITTTFANNGGDAIAAIFVESPGALIVRDSAFVQNGGVSVSGIAIGSGGTADVINTTFARHFGGLGPDVIRNAGTMTVINSTFAENTGSGGSVITIMSALGAITRLQNTIVVHNSEDTNAQDCAGVITSLGNNLIGDPSSCNLSIQLSDRIGDAGLGELVDDGTPGNAHFQLLSDSQAIDAANDAACPKKDQIDQPRKPQCDIGAVEFDRTPSSK